MRRKGPKKSRKAELSRSREIGGERVNECREHGSITFSSDSAFPVRDQPRIEPLTSERIKEESEVKRLYQQKEERVRRYREKST